MKFPEENIKSGVEWTCSNKYLRGNPLWSN
jgi:hypothetical protein